MSIASGETVRRRARAFSLNNPWAASGVQALVASIVGAGFTAASNHPDPGTRETLNAAFTRFSERVDPSGQTDINGILAQAVEAMILDGEALLQILPTDRGPKVALLSPEQLDAGHTRRLSDGTLVVAGVELAKSGARQAYYLRPYDPTQTFLGYADPVRVPADYVLHMFRPAGPGQVRGLSWFAPVLLRLRELDQLEDALTVGSKVAAMHAAFLKDESGFSSGEGAPPYDGTQIGATLEGGLEPGTIKVLPGGYDIRFNTPAQAQQTAEFLRSQLRAIAAGLGVPEHLLTGDLGNANYSSLRAGLLEFRRRVEVVQYHTVIPQILRPLWRHFVTWSLLSGDIEADPSDPALFDVDWIPPAVESIDPAKDATALEKQLGLGLTSRRQAVAARGYAVAALDLEIAADREREESLGLTFTAPATPETAEPGEPPAENDDD